MIRTLHLRDFKNFADTTVTFGPFTLFIGANASGKSNIRDALRFLQGVGLGYTLAEIMGGKYGPGGLPLWSGIRGGLAETARHGSEGFSIGVHFDVPGRGEPVQYQLEVRTTGTPTVLRESLVMPGFRRPLFSTHPDGETLGGEAGRILARVYQPARGRDPVLDFVDDRPVLMQIPNNSRVRIDVRERVGEAVEALTAMRFLDLSPERMREPSPQGQKRLDDRGGNLSSVLEALSTDAPRKAALLGWVQALTPMDIEDFEFRHDLQNQTLVYLKEASQSEPTSAASASDGTLRFLAMAAALLSPELSQFYFLEEFDNGIHPTRVALLLQLVEQRVAQSAEEAPIQVVATTHSPSVLRQLGPEARKAATLVYRLEDEPGAHTRRVVDIPEAQHVLEGRDIGRLFEAGWMETSMAFAAEPEAP